MLSNSDNSKDAALTLDLAELPTRIGRLTLVANGEALVAVSFEDEEEATWHWLARRFGDFKTRAQRDPAGAASALRAYFGGNLKALDTVRVDTGGTPFQRSVWSALRRIPAGSTLSYAALAKKVGREKAVRAVGAANGSNPIPVIVPCHRVIAMDGTLCGYGGGLDRKLWLLNHEGARTRDTKRSWSGMLPLPFA